MQIARDILLLLIFLLLPSGIRAQDQDADIPYEEDSLSVDVKSRMMQYADQLSQLSLVIDMQVHFSDAIPLTNAYSQALSDKVNRIQDNYQALDLQWTTFTGAMQAVIADSEELMKLMTLVQQLKQMVGDTINFKKQQCNALADFVKAEEAILGQDTVYASLYQKAFKLSLIQKLTPKLERLKASEQVLFARLQGQYAKAEQACELVPVLSERMDTLNEQFANIRIMSGKIQEMAYKPLVVRLKDYLISLACVAMLLLFVNLAITKYRAAKAARKQMKQYEDMMRRQGGVPTDYPTI